MERLADYKEKADEIVRLVMNDRYSVNDAIKMIKEKASIEPIEEG